MLISIMVILNSKLIGGIEMKIYSFRGRKNLCGKQVRFYRKMMHLTQTEFAAKLQVCDVILDQKAVSRIELEDRVVADYELWAIAEVLEVSIEDLISPALLPKTAEEAEEAEDGEAAEEAETNAETEMTENEIATDALAEPAETV